MSDGIRRINLQDREQGSILLSVALPRDGEPWGVLAPLRGTVWEGLVRTVSGEALSHSVHGWATPIIRELGPNPHAVMRRHPTPCVLSTGDQCVGSSPACRPGRGMPDCYEPPDADGDLSWAVSTALLDLRAGRFVVVVAGSEFVLL